MTGSQARRIGVSLLLLGVLSLGAVGCGASTTPATKEAASDRHYAATAVAEMKVFSSAGTQSALSAAAEKGVAALRADPAGVAEELLPGKIDTEGGRLLLTGLGLHRVSLFAFPTAKGKACWVLEDTGASCVDTFDHQGGISWAVFDRDTLDGGEAPGIVGVAADDVSGVDVALTTGDVAPAQLARSGFFYELRPGLTEQAIDSLVIHYTDGATGTAAVRVPAP
jgi:hypothetical protein